MDEATPTTGKHVFYYCSEPIVLFNSLVVWVFLYDFFTLRNIRNISSYSSIQHLDAHQTTLYRNIEGFITEPCLLHPGC